MIERRLEHFVAPREASAQERSRQVAAAAFAARAPLRRRPSGPLALAAAAAVALSLAVTPPGDAVADWVRDLVRPHKKAPTLTSLPAPGRVLVQSPGGTWVLYASGVARRLGSFADATWSPRGLFVAATRGGTLTAMEPDGTVRWSLTRPRRVHQPRWSMPAGYRVAYREGDSLRVVAGDGSGDRLLAAHAGAAAPAWKPGTRHLLAFATPRGAVELRDVDADRRVWRSAAGEPPASLEWVAGARSLAALRGSELVLLDGRGRARRSETLPGPGLSLSNRPGRTEVAVSVNAPDGTGQVLLVPTRGSGRRTRTLFAAPGPIGEVAFSPDGSTVLAARASEWLFLPVEGGRARTVAGVDARFDPRADTPRGPARVLGWR